MNPFILPVVGEEQPGQGHSINELQSQHLIQEVWIQSICFYHYNIFLTKRCINADEWPLYIETEITFSWTMSKWS